MSATLDLNDILVPIYCPQCGTAHIVLKQRPLPEMCTVCGDDRLTLNGAKARRMQTVQIRRRPA